MTLSAIAHPTASVIHHIHNKRLAILKCAKHILHTNEHLLMLVTVTKLDPTLMTKKFVNNSKLSIKSFKKPLSNKHAK